jgi:tetratricopeptide (TPR) repeat protein
VPKIPRHSQSLQRKPQSEIAANGDSYWYLDAAICFGLVFAIFAVYAQVSHFDFINYDDQALVYENPHTRAGLTIDNLRWAFTTTVIGNWMPVTLVSHLLDCQLFGMESGMHHLVNVLFHALASVLLFAVLKRATGERWASAFVALVFALHPLHVESVAWVAERKDVLCAVFWFLALYGYLRYVESPSPGRYVLIAAPFCLGLMSKAMMVTFPFALLLIDVWPLRRTQFPKTLWEKLPLIALSAVASVVTVFAQGSAKAFSQLAPALRMENALVSYVIYLRQMIWPTHLASFYMYPESLPVWQPAAALVLLVGVSWLAVYKWRSLPYFFAGWFWYLGTLVPVIGLVQVGAQSRADRYTYIPMVGLLWIVAWGARDIARIWPRAKLGFAAAGCVACIVCSVVSWRQVGYWRNGVTLFQHAVDVTENNFWMRLNLGYAHFSVGNNLMNSGHRLEAIEEFEQALRNKPDYAEADNNLGMLYANMPGHTAEAIAHFEAAVNLDPKLPQAQQNLGLLLASVPGRMPEAIAHLEEAQRLKPDAGLSETINRLRTGRSR